MKRFLGLAAIAGVAFLGWRLYQKGALIDESALAGRFEAQVDEALTRKGFRDQDVRRSIRTERRQKLPLPALWVETEREMTLPPSASAQDVAAEIRRAASGTFPLDFISERFEKDRAVLEYGKKGRVFQRLILLPTRAPKKTRGRKK